MGYKINAPRGTSDILPQEIGLWRKVTEKAIQLLGVYGYKEIRTPIFEETELFVRSMGESSEVVEKQMLNLAPSKSTDEPGQSLPGLSLRPEGTASIVRSYIQHNLDKKENLSKLYYIGPMFRGERPQKGRLRQFHQIGVEAIGPGTCLPYLDAEIIALSVHILKDLGLKDFKLKINSLGTVEDKNSLAQWLRGSLATKQTHLCEDCQSRFKRNVFRILDCKNKNCKEVVAKLNMGQQYLSKDSQNYFRQVKEALDSLTINFMETPQLVRGLDYYTHTVFEITDPHLGSQDALGAGGRYNNLAKELGGPSVDAVGFALGIERILLAMPKQDVKEDVPVAFLIALDELSFKRAFMIIDILRKEGISSDMNYRYGSLKSQMRLADKINARYAIILGENERKKEVVSIREMKSSSQFEITVSLNDFTELIRFLKN